MKMEAGRWSERESFEPGQYEDVPNEVYQFAPGISKSKLTKMACPLKSRGLPKPPTEAMIIGEIVHCAILEPERFLEAYASDFVAPADMQVLTSADELKEMCKALGLKASGTKLEMGQRILEVNPEVLIFDDLRNRYLSEQGSRTIIKPEVYSKACWMRDAVWAHPEASRLLGKGGTFEESHFWLDERTGELCKCRTDFLNKDREILDLKKVANASPYAFSKAIWDYRYHWQDAWYTRGVGAKDFIFIAVEDDEIYLGTKHTYAVECYDLTSRDRAQGRREVDAALDRYLTCKALDDWPTYTDNDRVNKLSLPSWAQEGGGWTETDDEGESDE